MVVACEYLTNIGITRQLIMNADLPSLRDHISQADPAESSDFLRSFHQLVASGNISEETAFLAVPNPAELRRRLRGIASMLS